MPLSAISCRATFALELAAALLPLSEIEPASPGCSHKALCTGSVFPGGGTPSSEYHCQVTKWYKWAVYPHVPKLSPMRQSFSRVQIDSWISKYYLYSLNQSRMCWNWQDEYKISSICRRRHPNDRKWVQKNDSHGNYSLTCWRAASICVWSSLSKLKTLK